MQSSRFKSLELSISCLIMKLKASDSWQKSLLYLLLSFTLLSIIFEVSCQPSRICPNSYITDGFSLFYPAAPYTLTNTNNYNYIQFPVNSINFDAQFTVSFYLQRFKISTLDLPHSFSFLSLNSSLLSSNSPL